MFTVYVQYKKMLQYSTTTVKDSTVQLASPTHSLTSTTSSLALIYENLDIEHFHILPKLYGIFKITYYTERCLNLVYLDKSSENFLT